MKRVYINFTEYDRSEWFSIKSVGTRFKESVQNFKKSLIESLEIGPDDCHLFSLVWCDLTTEDYDRLLKLPLNESMYSGEDYDFFKYLIETYDLYNQVVCEDDNSGNFEIINMYCEDHNLDFDDEDIYQEVCDLMWNDDIIYTRYIKKYVNTKFRLQ